MRSIILLLMGFLIGTVSIKSQEDTLMNDMAKNGMALFQGKERFENKGPSCISCHNVISNGLIPGGLFAKDLTDVYARLGEGLTGWLGAPPFPAMAASYNNNPLTATEREYLTAFFKYSNENKDNQTLNIGVSIFIVGGGIGLIALLILFQFIWNGRKKLMVKKDIFERQSKAWDAKS